MAGLMRAHEHTGDDRYRDFVSAWADHHGPRLGDHLAETGYDVNRWAPGFACLLLGEATGTDRYHEMARRVIEYALANGTRLDNAAFAHGSQDFSRQIWVDTAWHITPLLAAGATVFDAPEYHDEAVQQLNAFSVHAQNPRTGLFNHLYDEAADAVNGVFWGRGNGWMAMAYVEVLRHSEPDTWATRGLIHQHSRLLDGLLATRDDGAGLWHTVLDDPDTGLETSASAMALFGLAAVERDDLYTVPDADLEATWAALAEQVDDEGRVVGVSGGTDPGETVAHYDGRPRGTHTWGTGAFLMAAAVYDDLRG
jgi:unsaturated rhamnogalacturonyl hydrolase